jgi:hypothetical protein
MTNINTPSEEFLRFLADDISAGLVSVEDESDVVASLNALYPMGLNRIAWERVPNALGRPASSRENTGADFPTILEFFNEFIRTAGLADSELVRVVGDNVTTVAFVMPVSTIRKHLASFLELPQATYIVTRDAKWCFNYTFEDDAYFGKAPGFPSTPSKTPT